jgi:hypothetical protein
MSKKGIVPDHGLQAWSSESSPKNMKSSLGHSIEDLGFLGNAWAELLAPPPRRKERTYIERRIIRDRILYGSFNHKLQRIEAQRIFREVLPHVDPQGPPRG